MSRASRRLAPNIEAMEERLVLSPAGASTAVSPAADTLAVLNEFTAAYPSRIGEALYNPAVDVNHNGIVGQDDGRLLLHELPAIGGKIPLTLRVALAPADVARGRQPVNSGGVTHNMEPTVVGRAAPGSLIFTGTGTTDLLLKGPAVVADAQGNFSIKVKLVDGINQFDLQAVDRYGRQALRAFPILWLGFADHEKSHPRRD